ncbi:MAG: acylphosphatase [Nanoarchaeota archaeon]|nr:acylphosphatase [Nanoarchaeota archaeon]
MKSVKLIITGDVTLVGFRYFIRENAIKLNLKGYVRNIQDKVEVIFEGQEENVNKMIELCKKGPTFSKVTNVEINELNSQGFTTFEIR